MQRSLYRTCYLSSISLVCLLGQLNQAMKKKKIIK